MVRIGNDYTEEDPPRRCWCDVCDEVIEPVGGRCPKCETAVDLGVM